MKNGEAWITSQEKILFDKAAVTAVSPVIGTLAAAAALALKRREPTHPILFSAERSLYPGQSFFVRKLGDPRSDLPLLKICRKAMIDEVPQSIDILQGNMSLVGPRPDTPEHIEALFDAIDDPALQDEWRLVRQAQKPGIISSYAIHSHSRNLEGEPESDRFPSGDIRRQNALLRAELDIKDFHNASLSNDIGLICEAIGMAATNYRTYASRLVPARA